MTAATKAALGALYYSRVHRLVAAAAGGRGVILMFHQVSATPVGAFAPNAGLSVTPDFLAAVIRQVRTLGLEIVSLDEAHRRMSARKPVARFAAITFDDGYRDNAELALPVLKRLDAPFTIYIPTDFPDGNGILWWLTAEQIIRDAAEINLNADGHHQTLPTHTNAQKQTAFSRVARLYTDLDQAAGDAMIGALCADHGFDAHKLTRDLIMTWDELRSLNEDPLVTLGAHTMRHRAMAKLSEPDARHEITGSLERMQRELGVRPAHFSFPYGDANSAGPRDFALLREAGIKTGVTTQKGMLQPHHADQLTALPRLSLNGRFQDLRYSEVLLSGLPFALKSFAQSIRG